jgi:heterodisulfide reductase subunit B
MTEKAADKEPIKASEFDPQFKYQLTRMPGGEKLLKCFQCGTCTSDCPIARFSDTYRPRTIIRMAQLGLKDRALKNDTIWLCTACFTCTDRCPQGVEVASVIRVLRNLAAENGCVPQVFKDQATNILKSGYAFEIPELRIKKRETLGLPPLPKGNSESIHKSLTGVQTCALPIFPYRVFSFELSSRKVLARLGVELMEMPQFNCCGLPLDPVSHEMMLVLAARNLALAERTGLDIITLCPGCAGTLKKVNAMLNKDKALREQINTHLKESGLEFRGSVTTKHLLQVLMEDIGIEKIKANVTRPLTMLNVAEHNGCHILRPKEYIGFDDPENPQMLKALIEVTGATCLDYIDETECCGAPSVGVNDKMALQLARDKLNHIKMVEAQALITICPFCHIMYDTNELRIEKIFNEAYGIPVLHYPQLLGLAMGMTPEELAFNELRVNASELIKRINEGVKTK